MTVQEIKKSAKLNLKGSYLKCASASLIYFIIITVLSYLLNLINVKLEKHIVPLTLIQAIFGIISIVLSYGLISNILGLSQSKTNSITKFIDNSILNFGKYVKIIFHILIRILIPLAIFLLCLFYLTGTLIAYSNKVNFLCFYYNLLPLAIIITIAGFCLFMYFALNYTLVAYIANSEKDLKPKEIVLKSAKLMKGQKWNYIFLILSFFGWFLLLAVVMYILGYFIDSSWLAPIMIVFYTLIRPYIVESESIFLESLGN